MLKVSPPPRRRRYGPLALATGLIRKTVTLAVIGGIAVAASRTKPGRKAVEVAEQGMEKLRNKLCRRNDDPSVIQLPTVNTA